MRSIKRVLIVAFVILASIFLFSCSTATGGSNILQEVWKGILSIGKLEFLGINTETAITGFLRLMIGILVFAILFELATLSRLMSKNIAITVSIIISIMTAIFLPGKVLAAIGSAYALVISSILVGVPVIGALYGIYKIPGTVGGHLLRIVILFIALWFLTLIKAHAGTLGFI